MKHANLCNKIISVLLTLSLVAMFIPSTALAEAAEQNAMNEQESSIEELSVEPYAQATKSSLAATSQAEEPEMQLAETNANVCKIGDVEYATVQLAVDAATDGQTIQMIANSQENVTVDSDKNVTLDLNDCELSGAGSGTVIINSGALTIADSGATGTITGGATIASGDTNGGGIRNSSGARLTLSGGTISGNTVTASDSNSACGGGVYNEGTFTMGGGTITGNKVCGQTNSEGDNLGGGVYNCAGATFTMSAGTISENIATGDGANAAEYCYGFGGGVCTDGAFTMGGGTITQNCCDQNGGGILVSKGTGASVGGTLTVQGGTISDNTARWGAGITVDGANEATISSGAVQNNAASSGGGALCVRDGETSITGGTFEDNTAILGGGVYAFTGFTLDGEFNLNDDKDTQGNDSNIYLTTGALIAVGDSFWGECGVSKSGTTGEITRATYSDYAGCFKSDNKNYGIRFNHNNRFEISEFTVTVSQTEHGIVNTDKASLAAGETVTLGETHDDGYVLRGYTVTNKTTKEAITVAEDGTFTMPAADVSVSGKFAISQPVAITYVAPQNGSVKINGSAQPTTVQSGDTVTLEAVPASGYVLESYRVYKTGEEGTTVAVTNNSFTMPDYGVTVTANFKQSQYVAQVARAGYGESYYSTIEEAWENRHFFSDNTTITLLADVTTTGLTSENAQNMTFTLDLNGHVLALKADTQASVIDNYGDYLTITDSNPNTVHYFTYHNDSAWSYIAEPTQDDIAGAVAFADMGSATLVSGTTVIAVSGGCITGGTGKSSSKYTYGGGICNRGNCALTLAGGTICGNSAGDGGGVYFGLGGTFAMYMTGGTICGNYADENGGELSHASGIDAYAASFTMAGGSVTYNVGTEDNEAAGIRLPNGVTFGGKSVVSNNGYFDEYGEEYTEKNAYLDDDDYRININGLESGAHIGITLDNDTGQFTKNGSADDAQYFFSDYPYYSVQYNSGSGGYLELVSDVCKIEQTGTTYGTIADALGEAQTGDTISLITNVVEDVTVDTDKSVTINLNGKTLCAESDAAITNNGTLTLTDTGATAGKITGGAKGVDAGNGTLIVSGKLTIAGNTQNLYLPEGKTITVADGFSGAIGVTAEEALTSGGFVAITGTGSADYSSRFTSDDGYLIINGEGNAVKLHRHGGWSYTLSTDNKTISAGCSVSAECGSTGTALTISEPTGATAGKILYDGNAHPATLSNQIAWVVAGFDLPSVQYQVKNGDKWQTLSGKPKEVGVYKASITAGTGKGAKTAYVEYTITTAQESVASVTSDGTTTYYSTIESAENNWVDGSTLTLLANANTNLSVPAGQTRTLDLNGYVLNGTGTDSVITNSGALTIADSGATSSTHYFTYVSDGAWTLYKGEGAPTENVIDLADFTIEKVKDAGKTYYIKVPGGCITGGTGTNDENVATGGGVYSFGGSLTIEGGNIVGNTATNGGGIYVGSAGSATLAGGTVSGNTAVDDQDSSGKTIPGYGGGVYVDTGSSFAMNAGSISGNSANCGGGVFNNESYNRLDGGAMTMSGGTISGNKSKSAGGVYDGYTVALGGVAKISGNTLSDGSTTSNLHLPWGAIPVTVGTGENGVPVPAEDMSVGVTTYQQPIEGTPVKFASNGTEGDLQYFSSDSEVYLKEYADGAMQLVSRVTAVPTNTDIKVMVNTSGLSDGVAPSYQWYEGTAVYTELKDVPTDDRKEAYAGSFGDTDSSFKSTNEMVETEDYGSAPGCEAFVASACVMNEDYGSYAKITFTCTNPNLGTASEHGTLERDGESYTFTPSANNTSGGFYVYSTESAFVLTDMKCIDLSYEKIDGTTEKGTGTETSKPSATVAGCTYYCDVIIAGVTEKTPAIVQAIASVTSDGTTTYYSTIESAKNNWVDGSTLTLLANATTNLSVPAGQTCILDLNGYVLQGTGSGPVIYVDNDGSSYGSITVKDSSNEQTHYFIYNNDKAWDYIAEPADAQKTDVVAFEDMEKNALTSGTTVIAVSGGCITGGNGADGAGGGVENRGTFNFLSGNIVGNTVEGNGGGIWSGHIANVSGGSIIGNTSNAGGGIWSNNELTISGGDIAYNSVTKCAEEGYYSESGGGVCNDGGTFSLSSGTIFHNTAVHGGGVWIKWGEFSFTSGTVSGNTAADGGGVYVTFDEYTSPILGSTAKIAGNTLLDGTTANNLYLDGGETVTISGKAPFTEGASIGVTTASVPAEDAPVPITSNGSDSDLAYFASDNTSYSVQYNAGTGNDGYLELAVKTEHSHGETKYLTKITSEDELKSLFANGGSGYLENDVVVAERLNVAAGKTVDLCLNGHIIDGKQALNSNVIFVPAGATLNLADCDETTTRYFTDSDQDGCFYSYVMDKPSGTEGNDYLTIVGGAITGGMSTSEEIFGGAIYNLGTFTMSGGTLIGNSAYNGGALYNTGTCTLSGDAAMKGNLASEQGGGIFSYEEDATLTINDQATVSYNTAKYTGGIVNGRNSELFLNDYATVSYNTAGGNASSHTGALSNDFGATVQMSGNAEISHNTAPSKIVQNSGTFIMNGTSKICDNAVVRDSGSGTTYGCVYNYHTKSVFTMNDNAAISDNTVSSSVSGDVYGGGVCNEPSVGGVCTFTMSDNSTIFGNSAQGTVSEKVLGGGVLYNVSRFSSGAMIVYGNAMITGNTMQDSTDMVPRLSNLCLKGGILLTVDDAYTGLLGVGVDEQEISFENPYVFTNEVGKDFTSQISSDSEAYLVQYTGDRIQLTSRITAVPTDTDVKVTVDTNGLSSGGAPSYQWYEGTATGTDLKDVPDDDKQAYCGSFGETDKNSFDSTKETIDTDDLGTAPGGEAYVACFSMSDAAGKTFSKITFTCTDQNLGTDSEFGTLTHDGDNYTYIGNGSEYFYAYSTSSAFTMTNVKIITLSYQPIDGTTEQEADTETSKPKNAVQHGCSYYCEVTIGGMTETTPVANVHAHSWDYVLSKKTSDNDTVTATCKGTGTCDYAGTDKILTIVAPANLIYDGNSHQATFGSATTFLGCTLPDISYEYKANEESAYAPVDDTRPAGFYKASFTVGEGSTAKTASIEYQVAEPVASITVGSTTTYYSTISDAVNAWVDGSTLTLLADATAYLHVPNGETRTLDLNGYVLRGIGSGSVVANYGTLTIMDSNGDVSSHYFNYSKTSAWTLNITATDEQKSAAVDFQNIDESTPDGSLVKVYGGVITGGNNTDNGGGIFTNLGSTLTLNGVTICGNSANEGGGLYTGAEVTVALRDTAIVGNHASKQSGGAIINVDAGGAFTLSGIIHIFENTSGTDASTQDNLSLWCKIMENGPLTLDCLDNSSKIFVGLKYTNGYHSGPVTKENSTNYSKCFISDDSSYKIYNTGSGQVQIVKLSAHEHSWSYDTGTIISESDTLMAWCTELFGAAGNCIYNTKLNAQTVSIEAPMSSTYDGTPKAATLSNTALGGVILSESDIEYEGVYPTAYTKCKTAPTDAGTYKASITIGIGENAKTAYIQYEIEKANLTVSGSTANDRVYDATTEAEINVGEVSGIAKADENKVSVEASGTFSDKKAADNKNVYVIYSLSGERASNYTAPDSEILTATITKKALIADGAIADGKIYDGTAIAAVCTNYAYLIGVEDNDEIRIGSATGIFDTKDAGNGRNVLVSYTLTGIDAANYTVGTSTTVADIDKRPISLWSESGTKSYDGTPLTKTDVYANADKAAVDSVFASETVNLRAVGSVTNVSQGDVPNTIAYTFQEGCSESNYVISKEEGKLSITASNDLTISAIPYSGVYDGNVHETLATPNVVEGTTISYSTSSDGINWSAYTSNAPAVENVGSLYVRAKAENPNYLAASCEYTMSVMQKKLSVSNTAALDKTYDGESSASVSLGDVEGIVFGDDVKVSVLSAAFDDEKAEQDKTVYVTYTISGDQSENYAAPDSEILTASILARQLEIEGTAVSDKVYDGTSTANATIGTIKNKIDGDDISVSITSAAFIDKNAETSKPVTVSYALSGSDAKNYIAPAQETLYGTITLKKIKVSADNKTSYVGTALLPLTYFSEPLYSGDSFTGSLSCDANKDIAGSYDILIGSLSAGSNYSIEYEKGTYLVTEKTPQSLSFDGISGSFVSKTYGDTPFTEEASGAHTTISYESSNGEVATVDPVSGRVVILSAGETIIKATAEESATYAEATAQYLLKIEKKSVAVPCAESELIYNGKSQIGVVLPENAVYTLSNNTQVSAGDYVAVASLIDKNNYKWDGEAFGSEDQSIEWNIARKTVLVSVNNKDMILGEKIPAFDAQEEGVIGTDTLTYTFSEIDPKTAGAYSIMAFGEAQQGNYQVSYKPGTLTVSQKDAKIKVDADSLSKVLDTYRSDEQFAGKDLDVELRTSENVDVSDIAAIEKKIGTNKNISYIDASLFLIIQENGESTEQNIGDSNDTLISVSYTFDFAGKQNIQCLRVHNGVVDELSQVPNADGEYIIYDKDAGNITVCAKKYSTYAFVYDTSQDNPTPANDNRTNKSNLSATGDSIITIASSALIWVFVALCVGATLLVRRKLRR